MVKVLICGDYCPVGAIEKLALDGHHQKIFNEFQNKINEVDLSVCNLECPVAIETTPGDKFGPILKSHPKTISSLRFAGFDFVTLANNHIMDHGEDGLRSTMSVCRENGIEYFGAGKDLAEARKPLIKIVKGEKVAFFNFAENEFSNTHGAEPGANPLSLVQNYNDIQDIKKSVNSIIVIYHGGNETYNLPSPRLKETLRFFVDAGANAVIAHHTHCVSGYETYKNAPIFYGLGNFIFDYNMPNDSDWSTGMAVQLIINGNDIGFELIPFHQNDGKNIGLRLFTVEERIAFEKKLEGLNEIIKDDSKLRKAFNKFVAQKEKQYRHFLEPYNNRIFHGLYSRGYIPTFLSGKKRKLYLNLIRCESHRDVLLEILRE